MLGSAASVSSPSLAPEEGSNPPSSPLLSKEQNRYLVAHIGEQNVQRNGQDFLGPFHLQPMLSSAQEVQWNPGEQVTESEELP